MNVILKYILIASFTVPTPYPNEHGDIVPERDAPHYEFQKPLEEFMTLKYCRDRMNALHEEIRSRDFGDMDVYLECKAVQVKEL